MDRTILTNQGLKKALENRRDQLKHYFRNCPQALDYIDLQERAYGDHALGWATKLNYWSWNAYLAQYPLLSQNMYDTSGECFTTLIVSSASTKPLIVPYEMEFKIESYTAQLSPTPNAPNLNNVANVPRRGGLTFWLASGENTGAIAQLPYIGALFNNSSILPNQHNTIGGDGVGQGVVFFGSGMNPTSTLITYGVTNGTNVPNSSQNAANIAAPMTTGTTIRIKEIVPGQIKIVVGEVEIPIVTTYGAQVRESLIGKTRALGMYLRAGDSIRLEQLK